MKKKILIVLLVIVLIAIIIGSMYLIDINRMKNDEPVIFHTWGYSYSKPLNIDYETNQEQDYIVFNTKYREQSKNYDMESREFNSGFEELKKLNYPDSMTLTKTLGIYVRSHIEQTYYNDLHDIKIIYEGEKKNFSIQMSMLTEPLTDYQDINYDNTLKESIIDRKKVVILKKQNEDTVSDKAYYICMFKYAGVHYVVETINFSQEELVILLRSIFNCNMKSIIKQKTDEKFELTFHERKDLSIRTIVSKEENGFDIYSFAGDVTIKVGNKEYDLREAIINNTIRMEEIIKKAEKDSNCGKAIQSLASGGSNNVYSYKNYTIMDYRPMNEDRRVYIGVPYMTLENVNL